MKNKKPLTCALAMACLAVGSASFAYELRTHAWMTYTAQQKSNLKLDPAIAKDLGIDLSDGSILSDYYFDMQSAGAQKRFFEAFSRARMPDQIAESRSAAGWMASGAIREDDLSAIGCGIQSAPALRDWWRAPDECNPRDDPSGDINRVLNHFYDPISGTGLNSVIAKRNPDWALGVLNAFEDSNRADDARRNHFSWMDARRAMLYALRGRDGDLRLLAKEDRNAYWATAFRALGDAMHLLQDMAQPEHTRVSPFGHLGSTYEAYMEARTARKKKYRIDGTTVDFLFQPNWWSDTYRLAPPAKVSTLWSTPDASPATRTGLADYSNRGLFTEQFNLDNTKYGLPSHELANYVQAFQSDPYRNSITIRFLTSPVPDPVFGPSRSIRMTTESALSFLEPVYSLNRFNFDDQAELLIPRASSHSTALLDYFFRGRIDCIKDVTLPSGCRLVNLGNEEMTGAVDVYYEAQDGFIYPVPNLNVAGRTDVDVPKLDPADLSAGTAILFDTPTDPPPKLPGKYMVVFHGDLGGETLQGNNVGAIAAKDISLASGALYVLVGNYFTGAVRTFRVDGEGTRVLRSNEADPLEDWAVWMRAGWFLPGRAFSMQQYGHEGKQVLYGSNPTQYRTLSVRIVTPTSLFNPNAHNTFFAVDQGPKDYEKVVGFGWAARDPVRKTGDFRFFTDGLTITYKRTFKDSEGRVQVVTGPVAVSYPPNAGSFKPGIIDASGTRISDASVATTSTTNRSQAGCLITTDSSSTAVYYDMVFTLDAAPTLNFEEVFRLDPSSSSHSVINDVYTDGCGQAFGSGNSTSRSRRLDAIISGVKQFMYTTTVSSGTGGACGPTSSDNTNTYVFLDGALSASTQQTTTYSEACDPTRQNAYSGAVPLGPFFVSRILDLVTVTPPSTAQTFRGMSVPNNAFVLEFSPIGEPFFATPDGSVILHEPLNGRMPVFKMPPGFNQILTAVWL